MSIFITAFTILIIIPLVPLFAYAIGSMVPASHIVSRTCSFKITPERLWKILTQVNQYPEWQPKVEKVLIDTTSDQPTVFTEYSTRKRHTVFKHHERVQNKCLIRMLEERPAATSFTPSKIPTFTGSWTFEINRENDDQVTLKITEQGLIKKPLVRVTHLLLFGFHSRIDRFMNDLTKKIELDNRDVHLFEDEPVEKSEVTTTDTLAVKESLLAKRNSSKSTVQLEESADLAYHSNVLEQSHYETDKSLSMPDDTQQTIEETPLTESRIADKEWDLMSEIYERPSKA